MHAPKNPKVLQSLAEDLAPYIRDDKPLTPALTAEHKNLTRIERDEVDRLIAVILTPGVELCPVCRWPQSPTCGCEFGRGLTRKDINEITSQMAWATERYLREGREIDPELKKRFQALPQAERRRAIDFVSRATYHLRPIATDEVEYIDYIEPLVGADPGDEDDARERTARRVGWICAGVAILAMLAATIAAPRIAAANQRAWDDIRSEQAQGRYDR